MDTLFLLNYSINVFGNAHYENRFCENRKIFLFVDKPSSKIIFRTESHKPLFYFRNQTNFTLVKKKNKTEK